MNVHFSSAKDDWGTPVEFFNRYHEEFQFTLDVCAHEGNAKLDRYFSPEDDGLTQDWGKNVCWMNPPYGKQIEKWVKKAAISALQGATVVALLPARTDTKWFHQWVRPCAQLEFIKGRLKFEGAKHSAPFPSLIAIYQPHFQGF